MNQFTDQFTYTPALYINYKIILKSIKSKALNKDDVVRDEPDFGKFISSNKFWENSETRALLSFLAENFNIYRKNKTKFYVSAAIKIGKNRTSNQIEFKIQALRTKYKKENKEETGKARSKWPYLDEMNELFGNRENVNPDYLVSSISDDNNK
ncbi:14293_t:CDS:2, partial [Cetraspora pellucida]